MYIGRIFTFGLVSISSSNIAVIKTTAKLQAAEIIYSMLTMLSKGEKV